LSGQTGFTVANKSIKGTGSGAGAFLFNCGNGLSLTSSSFNLALNGTIEQEAGLVDAIPALKVLNSLPKIGGLLKTFNDSAKLKERFRHH